MNESNNPTIEYLLSDYSPVNKAVVIKDGKPYKDSDFQILRAASKLVDKAMNSKKEDVPLIVNINNRSAREKKS